MVLVMMALVTMVLVMILEIVSSQGKHTQPQMAESLQTLKPITHTLKKQKLMKNVEQDSLLMTFFLMSLIDMV
jgi:hypothetical protein